jgi:hypothetical protein
LTNGENVAAFHHAKPAASGPSLVFVQVVEMLPILLEVILSFTIVAHPVLAERKPRDLILGRLHRNLHVAALVGMRGLAHDGELVVRLETSKKSRSMKHDSALKANPSAFWFYHSSKIDRGTIP